MRREFFVAKFEFAFLSHVSLENPRTSLGRCHAKFSSSGSDDDLAVLQNTNDGWCELFAVSVGNQFGFAIAKDADQRVCRAEIDPDAHRFFGWEGRIGSEFRHELRTVFGRA